jgi:acyl-CoA thioesterase FadM
MTDYFGRTINVGDTIWVPATVTGFSGTTIAMSYTNVNGTNGTLTATGGDGGQTTNPAEGDRPPR